MCLLSVHLKSFLVSVPGARDHTDVIDGFLSMCKCVSDDLFQKYSVIVCHLNLMHDANFMCKGPFFLAAILQQTGDIMAAEMDIEFFLALFICCHGDILFSLPPATY